MSRTDISGYRPEASGDTASAALGRHAVKVRFSFTDRHPLPEEHGVPGRRVIKCVQIYMAGKEHGGGELGSYVD